MAIQSDEVTSGATLAADGQARRGARAFVRAFLTGHASPENAGVVDELVECALPLVDELVGHVLRHAPAEIEVTCRLEVERQATPDGAPAVPPTPRVLGSVIEVAGREPSIRGCHEPDTWLTGGTDGPHASAAESWGATCREGTMVLWGRVAATAAGEQSAGPGGPRRLDRPNRPPFAPGERVSAVATSTDAGGPLFLAQASELLAGQLEEDMVGAVAGQLLVPRLADWCGVWFSTESGDARLSYVWHADEQRIEALRRILEAHPPAPSPRAAVVPWTWSNAGLPGGEDSAIAFPLIAEGVWHGALLIGRTGAQVNEVTTRLVEGLARQVAQALVTARRYTIQSAISHVLQRRQLPPALAKIPGIETAVIYEPGSEGQAAGGDFYDVFAAGANRWCFLLGDVQGKDPEAVSAGGLARHVVRLLAREGRGVESVVNRLNAVIAEEAAEIEAAGGEPDQPQLLTAICGELQPVVPAGGARCELVSAGHPLPLKLSVDGSVTPAAEAQLLIGLDPNARFRTNTFTLAPGETLLCVTDGVTERRNGRRQLDDDSGVARILRGCVGFGAAAVAERVRQVTHDFGYGPVEDDLAVLVLHAMPRP